MYYTEVVNDIRDDVLKPLLLSPVPLPPSNLTEVVESVIDDIERALNGTYVDLNVTVAKYIKAITVHLFDQVISFVPFLFVF